MDQSELIIPAGRIRLKFSHQLFREFVEQSSHIYLIELSEEAEQDCFDLSLEDDEDPPLLFSRYEFHILKKLKSTTELDDQCILGINKPSVTLPLGAYLLLGQSWKDEGALYKDVEVLALCPATAARVAFASELCKNETRLL